LIRTGKGPDPVIALVAINAFAELFVTEVGQFREQLAC